MSDQENEGSTSGSAETSGDYEAPKVETVVTPEDLDREVQYAGLSSAPRG